MKSESRNHGTFEMLNFVDYLNNSLTEDLIESLTEDFVLVSWDITNFFPSIHNQPVEIINFLTKNALETRQEQLSPSNCII